MNSSKTLLKLAVFQYLVGVDSNEIPSKCPRESSICFEMLKLIDRSHTFFKKIEEYIQMDFSRYGNYMGNGVGRTLGPNVFAPPWLMALETLRSPISIVHPGLTPGTALRAIGSGITYLHTTQNV